MDRRLRRLRLLLRRSESGTPDGLFRLFRALRGGRAPRRRRLSPRASFPITHLSPSYNTQPRVPTPYSARDPSLRPVLDTSDTSPSPATPCARNPSKTRDDILESSPASRRNHRRSHTACSRRNRAADAWATPRRRRRAPFERSCRRVDRTSNARARATSM